MSQPTKLQHYCKTTVHILSLLLFFCFIITIPPTHSVGGARLVTVAGVCHRLL